MPGSLVRVHRCDEPSPSRRDSVGLRRAPVERPSHMWPALLALSVLALACASWRPIHETDPDVLRREIARDVPELSEDDVVIPHTISRRTLTAVRARFPELNPRLDGARALLSLLFDEEHLGLEYEWSATRDAETTIAMGSGNCVSLSAVVVGLARAHGGAARYVEVIHPPEEREEGDLLVWAGHVAVLLPSTEGMLLVDFQGANRPKPLGVRLLSDRAFVARYYLDLGYEQLHRARAAGEAPDWDEARRYFDWASRIDPTFGEAWNNLGVALARQGRLAEAEAAYRRARRSRPRDFVDTASVKNLAVLERRRTRAGSAEAAGSAEETEAAEGDGD